MPLREDLEDQEDQILAPFAARSRESRGRLYSISPDPLRTDFQRDRDRVIHSSAFRKLEFKTQVFFTSAGDYHRSRLTHTLEVAQIARTIARALALNPDLTEAIALSHDLGHTPFGHAGEDAMRLCMKDDGGFEHNAQGLRVVEILEERNPRIPGLNLTYEVREGIIKHDTDYDSPDPHPSYNPGKAATLEGQVCDVADEIAYNSADLDDALEIGFIEERDLKHVPWVFECFEKARREDRKDVREKFVKYRALSLLYDHQVHDAISCSRRLIEESGVTSLADVTQRTERLIRFSAELGRQLLELKTFLKQRVYDHPRNMVYRHKAQKFIREMFDHYLAHPQQLPWKYQDRIEREGAHRVICDYLAGMTDRYLMEQYQAAFMPEVIR